MLITHTNRARKWCWSHTQIENDVDHTCTELENGVDHRHTQLDKDVDHTRGLKDVDQKENLITYGFYYFNLALRIGTRKNLLCHNYSHTCKIKDGKYSFGEVICLRIRQGFWKILTGFK